MMKLSVLDLAPIVEGSNTAAALQQCIALAKHADGLGYHRFWVAEHHNMDGVASAATAILIGQLAAATGRIRVGSG
ncbi:LLM class flavin-dependent oxidoreductase, partial [Roseateles sp. GG27B]